MKIATIGTFDGVHTGHVALLEELKRLARKLALRPAVVTFDPMPVSVLRPESAPKSLMSVGERVAAVRSLGISDIILLSFTPSLAQLSAEEFMLLLRDKYAVHALLIGYDHHFGKGAKLSFSEYVAIGERIGMQVFQASPLASSGSPVSSSRIREALLNCALGEANNLLGRAYSLSGQVVGGMQIGRSLGYPTANIKLDDPSLLVPADGVYAVRVQLDSCSCGNQKLMYTGMLSIGNRPTLSEGLARTIEVHIFDLNANLYAERLTLVFERYMRANRKFESLEELQKQIGRDEQEIRAYFGINKNSK